MSKGSAIVSILIAFVGGLVIGNLTGRSSGTGDEMADIEAEGEVGAAEAGGPERFKVPVTAAQPAKGPSDALITIVEFSDFECPFCSRVGPTISRIMNEYKGKVRVVWRNNPLPFHQNAGPAAQAAMEAFAQGDSAKFWKMHDILFENQRALSRADLERYAQKVGLDMGRFRKALDGNAHQSKIQADQQLATQIGARGTPAFFINGRQLMGAQPFENFKEVIDDEIKRAEALRKTGIPAERLYAALMRNAKTSPEAPSPQGAGANQAPRQPDPNAVYRVPVGNSPQKGPADALITIAIFSDFQCPFCSRVNPTIAQIKETYGRDVRFVWKNNPLPFHQDAMPAAEAAMEVFAHGGADKFWRMHDLLFQNQQALSRADIEKYAQQVGANVAKVKQALDNHTHKASIEADQNLARSLGASGTPSFFINGRNLRGAQPFEAFKTVIDEELAKAKAKVAAGTPRARVYEEIIRSGATEAKFVGGGAAPSAPSPGGAEDADRVYNIPVPADAPRKGNARAKVVIQEFSDFQCPFCSRVLPTVEQILKEYGSKVQIVWRNYPLPFHQQATPAAEAAREVFKQKGAAAFWAYHDLLFKNQQALARENLEAYAQQVGGINMARFKAALDNHTHKASIDADMEAVRTAGAQIGTPSFFINGRLLQGAQPFEAFKAAIDKALAAN